MRLSKDLILSAQLSKLDHLRVLMLKWYHQHPGQESKIEPRDYTTPSNTIACLFVVCTKKAEGTAGIECRVLKINGGTELLLQQGQRYVPKMQSVTTTFDMAPTYAVKYDTIYHDVHVLAISCQKSLSMRRNQNSNGDANECLG